LSVNSPELLLFFTSGKCWLADVLLFFYLWLAGVCVRKYWTTAHSVFISFYG